MDEVLKEFESQALLSEDCPRGLALIKVGVYLVCDILANQKDACTLSK